MKILIPFLHNVRRGLATNSSSSHSLVFHADPVASDNAYMDDYSENEFGWDHFILGTLGEKLMYGLTMAVSGSWEWSPEHREPDDEDVARAKARWGALFPEITDDAVWERAMQGYVDHQSVEEVTPEFLAKLRDPHVVVHGGNDNGGYPDIEWGWDAEKGEENDVDHDLPAGARREMLG